jgi:hypothetical protein
MNPRAFKLQATRSTQLLNALRTPGGAQQGSDTRPISSWLPLTEGVNFAAGVCVGGGYMGKIGISPSLFSMAERFHRQYNPLITSPTSHQAEFQICSLAVCI